MIRNQLLQLREERGVSQQELADALNVSRQTIARWENGECEPSIGQLKPICDYFNVSIDDLMGEKECHYVKHKQENVWDRIYQTVSLSLPKRWWIPKLIGYFVLLFIFFYLFIPIFHHQISVYSRLLLEKAVWKPVYLSGGALMIYHIIITTIEIILTKKVNK